ncbi:protein adenylyltransferase SelO [Citricoccus sp. NR2]|uniref:protein adenylyltransferase SelO n=1 Tax=Citricoccus sp. NR2 TaxID=3004095 RepID=UPI0022DD2EEC|nr:YdiU family protein [Citricoccus sp. NR2]WBL20173.1 YdiU family protein [Citricoccus sp. NR2]
MAVSSAPITLSARFAQAFPELSIPWQAEATHDPGLVILNEELAQDLGLDVEWLRTADGLRFLTGEALPEDAQPVAQGYAGHQFGMYSPRLGDGRALLLGEITDAEGRTLDLHLKGSGRSPFARGAADGQAVLGPMLREYLISEAMHALGVPTTRALAVITTGREVYRDTGGPGAMLVRVASSHLRVGSFQYAHALESSAENAESSGLVARLVEESLHRHYPNAVAQHPEDPAALTLFREVAHRQAKLVAQWMQLGFIHGVMNTDNMTISGETIDYGPCAFMDEFDPRTVFSSIDHQGRYAFGNQPPIAEWNLARLGETLLPLIDDDPNRAIEAAQQVLNDFAEAHRQAWFDGMRTKLGLSATTNDDVLKHLTDRLFALMAQHRTDYTSFFRILATAAQVPADQIPATLAQVVPDDAEFHAWVEDWQQLGPDPELMDRTNPIYIPRNHLVEDALAAATGELDFGDTAERDLAPFLSLLEVQRYPFAEQPGRERYALPAPETFGRFVTYCGT